MLELPSSRDSPKTLSHIRRWIDTCEAEHKDCSGHSKTTPPARLLDLGVAADENGDLQLCEGQKEIAPYVTLSHCWGSCQPLRTTKANLDLHLQKIRFSDLPKTFQDAVVICRGLGIRYAWIDSLCIIQDDDEDWQIQSANMASIYEGSVLTIAASSARDGTEGCFLATPDRYREHTLAWPGTAEGGAYSVHVRRLLPHVAFWEEDEEKRREVLLFGRGWFYQERFLSRRVVHFTKWELWWECQTISTCECNYFAFETKPRPQGHVPMEVRNRNQLRGRRMDSTNDEDPDSADPWHLCVRAYLPLSLTFEKDIFPAVSGLANRVQQHYKPGLSYYAGLWLSPERNDLNELLWINEGFPEARVKRWRAPTWSWASVARVNPKWMKLDPRQIYARLVDVKVKLYGVDEKGELRDAYIRILAPMVQGFIHKPNIFIYKDKVPYPRDAEVDIEDEPYPKRLRPLVRLDINPELRNPPIVPGDQVFCLRLGRVLREKRGPLAFEDDDQEDNDVSICLRVVDAENGEAIFERIGIATHNHVLGPMVDIPLYTVKIV
jgi:hypothetical protein